MSKVPTGKRQWQDANQQKSETDIERTRRVERRNRQKQKREHIPEQVQNEGQKQFGSEE